jgi:hypothetical protein
MIDINRFILERKIKKILKKSKREKAYRNLNEIESVLLFFDTRDYSDANHFIQQLNKMNKKVQAYAYKDKNDTNDYSKIFHRVVTEKDLNIWKLDSLKELVKSLGADTHYDLAIDLTHEENILFQYLLASADAFLKVGFSKSKLPIYDMVISFASEKRLNEIITTEELSKQLIHYLSTISSNTRTE